MSRFSEILESLYSVSPVIFQNIMVSGQGLIFKRQRFNDNFENELKATIERSSWSQERLNDWQFNMLIDFLNYAKSSSPYWSEKLSSIKIDIDIKDINDLRKIPIMEKESLRSLSDKVLSLSVDPASLIKTSTSGTTGSPMQVGLTCTDMQKRMAFLYRMLNLFNIEPMARSVRFSGRTIFPRANKNKIFWRYNKSMNQLLMSSYDLHPDNLKLYIEKLINYRPVFIDGYPSSIYILARFINANGYSGQIRPKAIMTTAETLEDFQKLEIQEAFGHCPVINQYASSEGAPFITQDPDGELVVNTDSGVFEFVKPGTDEPAKPGELAEMLVTSFTTHAYPLIRYRIGDSVLLPKTPRVSCFWGMPVVEKIIGRQDDIIFTEDRGYVGRLDPVFKKSPSTIIESQIEQVSINKFILRVVPDHRSGYDSSQLDGIVNEMKLRLGNVEVEVEECISIPRGASGKLRAVIGFKNIK